MAVAPALAPLLKRVEAEIAAVAAADEATLSDARTALAASLHALLLEVSSNDVEEGARRLLDVTLSKESTALKGALLKALKECRMHRAFLGPPALKEATRKLLAAAPAKGVASYLETELCDDICSCEDLRALLAVREVREFFVGARRLKKVLDGVQLPATHKKTCRTVVNRTARAHEEREQRLRQQAAQGEGASSKPRVYELEKDTRLEDAQEEEEREGAKLAAMDSMFEKAMQLKKTKGR